MSGGPSDPLRWIETFLDAQAAELDASRNTLLAYGRDLKDVAAHMTGRGLDFGSMTRRDIEDYLVACDAEGLSKATRARRNSSPISNRSRWERAPSSASSASESRAA